MREWLTCGAGDVLVVERWDARPGGFDSSGSSPYEFHSDYDGDVLVLEGAGPHGSRIRHRTDYPDDNTTHTVLGHFL